MCLMRNAYPGNILIFHVVFLASMAVINGAKSLKEIKRTVKSGFFSVIRVSI